MLAFQIFKRYFFSKRAGALVRSLARLCLIGNIIGVAALVLVLSVMNGFNKAQSDRLLSIEPHLIIKGIRAEQNLNELLEAKTTDLSRDDIVEVSNYDQQDVILRTVDGAFSGGVAKGLMPGPLTQLMGRANMSLSEAATVEKLGAQEILIGAELAASLGVFDGDELTLIAPEGLLLPSGEIPPFEKVRVQGLLSTGMPLVDSQFIYYDRTQALSGLRRATSIETGIEVRLSDPGLEKKWAQNLRENNFQLDTWSERNSALFFALKMEKYAMGAFLTLTLLITSFSLVTVLIMLITQKRKEIGLLMALGLSKRRALFLFQSIGFALAASGMFIGLILGLFLSTLLQHIRIPLLPDIYTDPTLPALIVPLQIFYIFMSLLALAFFASWLPVRGSLEMTPSQALRSKN
jgi:lipoprotein-releasing system permease protein